MTYAENTTVSVDLLLPDGRTMHRALAEQIEASYKTGAMPPLLGMGES